MTDALRTCQQRIHELFRLERVGIAAADHLEPFHRVAGGVLDARDVDGAHLFVGGKHFGDFIRRTAELSELPGQLDRILERELGAGADGEMRSVRRVPHQHDMALPVEMAPLAADQPVEIEPRRAAQVPGIAQELGTVENLAEKFLAKGDRTRLVGFVEALRPEDVFRGLDDEGRGVFVELVDMRLEPAMLSATEIEREGVVAFLGAEPDEAVRPHDQVRLESISIPIANFGIDPVRGDDEVGIGKFQIGIDLPFEHELDAQLLATRLQDVEKLFAADADEAVAGGAHAPAFDQDLDVVPMVEGAFDLESGFCIPRAHVLHGGVGKYDTPAERIVGLVALDHGHVVSGILLLHQQTEIKPRRAAADANNAHIVLRPIRA